MSFFKKYRNHLLIGALAGTINGLLGAGGGIIITFFLSRTLSDEQKSENGVFANAVATMLPISAISLAAYLLKGAIKPNASIFSLVPIGLVGGFAGAFLLTKLNLKIVKIIFSLLVVISGAMMIFK